MFPFIELISYFTCLILYLCFPRFVSGPIHCLDCLEYGGFKFGGTDVERIKGASPEECHRLCGLDEGCLHYYLAERTSCYHKITRKTDHYKLVWGDFVIGKLTC